MMPDIEFNEAETLDSTSITTYPNKKQLESNYLSRCIEVSRFFGAPMQGAYFQSAISQDLNSDEVTADVQIGTVIGNGTGFIFGLILHYCIRQYYRTGEYCLKLMASAPDEEDKLGMNNADIILYQEQGRLKYLIKTSSNFIEGSIDSDHNNNEEAYLDQECYETLLEQISKLEPKTSLIVSGKYKNAFLHFTATRGHTHSAKTSTNPLYRNFKTLANFGWQLGAVISNFIGVQDRNKKRLISYILSDICCLVLGLFALPYWLIREKIFKIPANTKHEYDVTGQEGWSKYTKTALTFGTALGQAVGGLVAAMAHNATAAMSSFSIAFWGGVVGVGSFVLSLIAVPLINWISSKFTRDGKGILTSNSKNAYRNNYTRSGMVLGAALGACLGLFLGNWCFGIILAATIFSALGSVIGGIAISLYGHKMHKLLHSLPPNMTETDEDIENSFDYASRSFASVFGFIGAAVVCAINPAAALLLVPIGTAIASGIGWCLGLLIMRKARSLPGNEKEKKALSLPWTQRITMGANIGSIIGGSLGVVIGLAGFVLAGPASIILAVSLFGAVGAVVGGACGALYDKQARSLVWQGIKSMFCKEPINDNYYSSSVQQVDQQSSLGSTARAFTQTSINSQISSAEPDKSTTQPELSFNATSPKNNNLGLFPPLNHEQKQTLSSPKAGVDQVSEGEQDLFSTRKNIFSTK